jgi:hypothetical protein
MAAAAAAAVAVVVAVVVVAVVVVLVMVAVQVVVIVPGILVIMIGTICQICFNYFFKFILQTVQIKEILVYLVSYGKLNATGVVVIVIWL